MLTSIYYNPVNYQQLPKQKKIKTPSNVTLVIKHFCISPKQHQTYFRYENENKNENDSFSFYKKQTISFQKTK